MRLNLLILSSLLLISFRFKTNKPQENIGMHYYIKADKVTNCNLKFPDGLSYFFEQIEGFGDQSEVSQVSTILNVDLSVFQNYDYGTEDTEEEKTFWQDIIVFKTIIDGLIEKINQNTNYYKLVRYNKNKEQLDREFKRITENKASTLFIKELEELQKQPDYLFPADSEYLSTGLIKDDLKKFRNL